MAETSCLSMHVMLVHRICVYGHTVLCLLEGRGFKITEKEAHELLTEFCVLLQTKKQEIDIAIQAIKEVTARIRNL